MPLPRPFSLSRPNTSYSLIRDSVDVNTMFTYVLVSHRRRLSELPVAGVLDPQWLTAAARWSVFFFSEVLLYVHRNRSEVCQLGTGAQPGTSTSTFTQLLSSEGQSVVEVPSLIIASQSVCNTKLTRSSAAAARGWTVDEPWKTRHYKFFFFLFFLVCSSSHSSGAVLGCPS